MPSKLILLSGSICAGKTTLALALRERFSVVHTKTSECIRQLRPHVAATREAMQAAGEDLDKTTAYSWVRDGLRLRLQKEPENAIVVLDAVRHKKQIDAIRAGYGNRVYHIHLNAPREVLSGRYATRKSDDIKEFGSYDEAMKDPTEAAVPELAADADVVISSERCNPIDVLLRAASHAGLFGRSFERVVDIIVGGQYGSEGKGQVAAYLAPEYDVLVRVGGPNAGHTVYREPKPYTYHHLPSGTNTNPNAHVVLPPGCVVYPKRLLEEIAECDVEYSRLSIDPRVMVITDADRTGEASFQAAMGSTAQGVGLATARRVLQRKEPEGSLTIAQNVPELKPYLRSTHEVLDRHFHDGARVMLEGTQGTGLSLYHGDYPYVTSRDTSVAGCLSEAGISPSRARRVIMVCRSYPIRVESPKDNTSGPMGIPIDWKTVSERSGISVAELEKSERTSTTNRSRRVAEFDWHLFRRSASLNAPTDIALTFADYFTIGNRKAQRVEQLSDETKRFIEELERVSTAPVSLISTRFHSRAIIDRRAW